MTLDEIRTDWTERESRLLATLDRSERLAREALVLADRRPTAAAWIGRAVELVAWAGAIVWFGAFVAAHFDDWRLLLPALALQTWTIVVGVATLAERRAVSAVDFAGPPVEVQARLASLRTGRARTFKWALLTGQVIWWVPFAIVAVKSLWGVDLWTLAPFMPWFLALNLAAGLMFIPVALAAGRAARPWLAGRRVSGLIIDAVTGHDLAQARALAARLVAFDGP